MIRYVLLGIVQGLTEFLPVSSSGHLVLLEKVLGFDPPGVLLELLLHLGTLVAVLVLFRRDIWRLARSLVRKDEVRGRRELLLLALGTTPIVLLGLLLRRAVVAAFSSLLLVGVCLLVTGGVLLLAGRAARRARRSAPRLGDSLLIGVAQGAALLPGISRSGATIASGILLGIEAQAAARFSFLLSVPAILGAGILELPEGLRAGAGAGGWPALLVATLVAAAVAGGAIKGLLALLARGKLGWFGVYCLAIGLVATLYATLR